MNVVDLHPRSDEDKFLNLPYDDRWERLKPVIVELYMGHHGPNGRSLNISQVAQFMKIHYSLYAAESQYKRWFSKWNVRKRIVDGEKKDIVQALGRRKRDDTSTSHVLIQQDNGEKRVDKRQLKRYLRDEIRKDQQQTVAVGVLSSWDLPYAALTKSISKAPDKPSPFGNAAATPGYLVINSPPTTTSGQNAGPSPPMQLVREALLRDRSSLFCQGRHEELLRTCGKEDRIILTNYLHDFYMQSFVAAKHWGHGPRAWTGGMVSALTLGALNEQGPRTPASIASSPAAHSPSTARGHRLKSQPPDRFCRWAVHVNYISYRVIPKPTLEPQVEFDVTNTSSWRSWTDQEIRESSFADSMKSSIMEGTFTSLTPEDLPISIPAVSQSLENDSTALETDAWKFAIIAGNVELLEDMFEKNRCQTPASLEDIHPLHLAANYLDGGKSCCKVFSTLCDMLGPGYSFRNPVDNLGHTVLDTLLIAVLRSHTAITPDKISPQLGSSTRFSGEEKDICGRWDVDTPAVRELFQHGYTRIPVEWKHPFCHTAVQAVCHSAIALFGSPASPDINTSSGLFVKRCANCGTELRLGPLHAIVVTSFHLAEKGMLGETLFGPLALLVCLLRLGADASLSAAVSADDLLGMADPSRCNHVDETARQLMEAVPTYTISKWTVECQTGWWCLSQTLLLAEKGSIHKPYNNQHSTPDGIYEFTTLEPTPEARPPLFDNENMDSEDMDEANMGDDNVNDDDSDDGYECCPLDEEEEGCAHTDWVRIPGGNADLGVLWAAIQVEILTYRRLEDDDPWISKNFSMLALRSWLDGETDDFCTPLVKDGLMRTHTKCGWFMGRDFFCPIAEEVCKIHFMNMDMNKEAYGRATFNYRPHFCSNWGDIIRPESGNS